MKYPYFRGLEADRYSFYRVPKALIKVDLFEKMSGDAKLLYAVLLDRMNLSLKNGWQDENGNTYIICTIDEIMDSIRCARQKAVKLLDELEHEYQLIERRRQGLGKPNLLYVKDLYAGLSQSNYWKYENQTSGGLKSELPGVWKSNGSKTDINNTDSSETDLIYSAQSGENISGEMREDERYRFYFQDKLEIPILEKNFPHDREILMEILELLVETVTSRKKFLRICGEEKPKEVVKSRLMKLDSMHIQYVMECLKSNTTQVVNFKTTKHFRDKRNHYVDRSQWQITENVHEPIIDRADFETAQRILENAPVRRPNGDGEIHPLSGLLFCKDCGAKMHIRIDYRNGGKRHVAYCSEYHKGKAKKTKCHSPHIIDADLLMQTVAEVLKKIEDYSISNRAEFEALVKKSLAMQQTDQTKKQQKRIPQITTRLEQIDKVLNKLYEDNALGAIPQDRYEQMSQKYSEEYYTLKTELAGLQEQLSAFENAGGRAQKFLKLTERHAAFTDLTPAILNEFISRIEVHERDQKRARYAIQHISIYFNYIGKFENEVTQLAEPTEQEIRQMREEIEEAKKEKSRAYHRQYSREYRARNLEKQREYDRIKAREYRAKKKAQAAAAQPTQ